MKPFDLEKALAGDPVATRDGIQARVICADLKNSLYPVLVVLMDETGNETAHEYTKDGDYTVEGDKYPDMKLFMATKKVKRFCIIKPNYGYATRKEAEAVVRSLSDGYEIIEVEPEE